MQAIGIIAEYNPFHNGHQLHIKNTKEKYELPIIAVMSGSFMQRGEPAFIDKWLRARMAILGGVDLVLELPTAFSLRSAQYFAQGGVKLLQATGLTDYLSCGAEKADLDYKELAKQKQHPATQAKIHDFIKQGMTYAKACSLALGSEAISAMTPNNILALEYAKALLNTPIKQIIIPRTGGNYNESTLSLLASATAIRKAYQNNDAWQTALPPIIQQLLKDCKSPIGYSAEALWLLLSYRLRNSAPQEIASTTLCKEGLENLLKQAAYAKNFDDAVSLCLSKRYPASHIKRLFMQLLLNKPNDYWNQNSPAYIRVLAFNNTGRQLLSEMKRVAHLPIITKLGKNSFRNQSRDFCQQLELDIMASDIVALLRNDIAAPASDFLTTPYYCQ